MQKVDPVDGRIGTALWARADRVLPGGGIYLSRSADFAGRGVLPGFIKQAQGCRVTDVDGRTYIDFLGANGPNLLGYRHPEVEDAARAQANLSTSASLFPPALIDVVEALLDRYARMSWGLVAKNGSEVVSLAVRVARQATARSGVIAFNAAYHGSDDELASSPPPGPLSQITQNVHRVPWNDAVRLRELVKHQGDSIACLILNPLDQNPRQVTQSADTAFLEAIAQAQQHGIHLVLDDVRHGFRLHPQGSEHLLGVDPDLVCLGKALGNGYAISALLGKEPLRRSARKILYTSTYLFEAPPMRAAIATLDIYTRDNVFAQLNRAGEQLRDGLLAAAAATGHRIDVSGPATMPTLLFDADPEHDKLQSFARAAAGMGAIFHPALNWNLSLAHQPADIEEAIAIAKQAMSTIPP